MARCVCVCVCLIVCTVMCVVCGWVMFVRGVCDDLGMSVPCIYTVVKCGSSGHNIRVAADLDSAAVGMVVIGNQLTATRQVDIVCNAITVHRVQQLANTPLHYGNSRRAI